MDTFREMAPDNADSDISFRVSTEIPEKQFNALMASIDEPEIVSARMRQAYDNLWKIELD